METAPSGAGNDGFLPRKFSFPYPFLNKVKPITCKIGSHNQVKNSMSTLSEAKQKAVEYAKNYPLVLADSNFMGPVTVGNIGEYNGRRIVNLCIRTTKSDPSNATISFPLAWKKASQFKPGDQVNIKVEDGFVKNIWLARPEPIRTAKISAAVVNQQVAEAMEQQAVEQAVKQVVAEATKSVPANSEEAPF